MSGYSANTIQTGLLQLVFNAVGIASIASSAASSPSTALWVALHTADPTAAGNQASSETTYTSYARVATLRSTASGGWVVSGNSPATANPTAAISFATCTASSTTVVTNFSVGLSSSGNGTLLYSGPVTQNITITTNVTPSLTTGTAVTQA